VAHNGRNHQTGEVVKASKDVGFKAGTDLKGKAGKGRMMNK